MPVIAMKCMSVLEHPNANSLKLYEFEAPNYGSVQIIANLDNIYKVDDLVYIALEGSELKDGTKIKPTKLRGVRSYGMALGTVEDPNMRSGDDFTSKFCIEKPVFKIDKLPPFIKWPDIENFHNIVKDLRSTNVPQKINYIGKVKIDGTNCGVQITKNGFFPQSRSRVVTTEKDNMGFAAWVAERADYFSALVEYRKANLYTDIVIFGEFCGQGIQGRTAISNVKKQIIAVFAIQYGGTDGPAKLEVDPVKIRAVLPVHQDIYVMPWYGEKILINFHDKLGLEKIAELLNKEVDKVEKTDPWVKAVFGIEGVGEGLVYYPLTDSTLIDKQFYTDYVFKAKGEKHKVVNTKKSVQLEPEFVSTINNFVDLFVTENRLSQGVTVACDGEFDMKRMGDFLKWINVDVKKESKDELEVSNLEWKQVSKFVTVKARNWYKDKALGV